MNNILNIIKILGLFANLLSLYYIIKYTPKHDQVVKINHHELNRLFGTPLEIRKGIVVPLPCVDQWYALLRQSHKVLGVGRYSADYEVHSDFIIRTHEDCYFHVLISTQSNGKADEIATTKVQYKNSLNEARVRTALFNNKQSYMQAFGELPKRKARSQIKT